MAMPTRTLIVGNDGANVLQGGASAELIYGFDPNGPQGNTSALAATRVAAGLAEPVFATAPPGDVGRLFIVEKGGRIQILDLATGAMLAAPFLDITSEVNPFGEAFSALPSTPTTPRTGSSTSTSARPPATPRCAATRSRPATRTAPTQRRRSSSPPSTIRRRAPITAPGGSASVRRHALRRDRRRRHRSGGGAAPRHPARQDPAPRYRPRRLPGRSEPELRRPGRQSGRNRRHRRQRRRDRVLRRRPAQPVPRRLRPRPRRPLHRQCRPGLLRGDQPRPRRRELRLAGDRGLLRPGRLPELHAADPRLCARQRRVGHRRLRLPRRERGPARAVLLRRFVTGQVWTLRFNGSAWIPTERTGQISPDAGQINNPSSCGEDGRGNLYLVDFDGDVFRLTPQVASADQGDDLRGGGGDDMVFAGSGADRVFGEAATRSTAASATISSTAARAQTRSSAVPAPTRCPISRRRGPS